MLLIIKSSNDSTDTVLIFYLFIYFLRGGGGRGDGGWGDGGREIEGAFISLCEDPWSGQGMKPSKTVKF